ncbi:hypothetical protein [Glaciihabitans sp. UYNi722]|uniref:hypothetical protein n=1 Tax=Glaciihabitans sp. UYNi722 TaxID=3156344 RepID=UPI00339781D2
MERERRFLIPDVEIVNGLAVYLVTQAYFTYIDGYAYRLRVTARTNEENVTTESVDVAMKGPRRNGERLEDEKPLSDVALAKEIIDRWPYVVIKHRYWGAIDGEAWVIDVFHGDNEGLVIAELEGTDIWGMGRPAWAGREITRDPQYNNEILARFPMRKRYRDAEFANWSATVAAEIEDPTERDDPDY